MLLDVRIILGLMILDGKLVVTPHIGGLNNHQSNNFDKTKSNLKEVKNQSLDGYNFC